jgi:AcrR family transcriptional regulator
MPKLKDRARQALVEERKAQILTASAKVFAHKGFERATIADIAKEAGVAEGSIYNYFKNKADLLVSLPHQIIQPTVEAMSGQLFQRAATPPPPDVLLVTVARNMLATMHHNAHIMRILLSALPTMKQATREKYLQNVVVYATGMLETYFREQIEQGVFRRDLHAVLAARIFVGMFFPFVMLQDILQVGGKGFDYEQVIAQAVQLFLEGVLAEPQKGKRK